MISKQFVTSIINVVNPLWLPDEKGNGKVFTSYTDCYVYFMDKCLEVAPKGYMDLIILLVRIYGWTFNKSIVFFKTFAEERMGERITLLKIGDMNSKAFYRKFITCMHAYYSTHFDLAAFSQAWDIHKNHTLSKQLNVTDYEQRKKTKAEGDSQ